MKLKILSQNAEKGTLDLPKQFTEEIRPDLIKKAVRVIQNNRRQKYGADPEAGKRASAELSRRRHDYRGSYGAGISRVPRKILTRRGTRMYWVGAVAPGTVGGRRAHPPKAEKEWSLKINKKEKRKAIRSAISATIIKELVEERGHIVPDSYPFVLSGDIESIEKAKDLKNYLASIGLKDELERASKKKIRAGKGKSRGRKYRTKKGPLIVVSSSSKLITTGKNIPGLDIVAVEKLNAELLAPGTDIARLTLFTEPAIREMEEKNMFFDAQKNQVKKLKEKAGKKEKEKKKANGTTAKN